MGLAIGLRPRSAIAKPMLPVIRLIYLRTNSFLDQNCSLVSLDAIGRGRSGLPWWKRLPLALLLLLGYARNGE